MKVSRFLPLGILVLLTGIAAPKAQEIILITEFMAANNGAVRDEDGDTSDWIEIYNAGTAMVNLGSWHLTDQANDLSKWTFPATNLAPGRFLLVFASGKNRTTPGAPLHTSFQLNSAGEYLALVKPDGQTIAHQFAPAFPPQVEGVSFGTELRITTTPFLASGAETRWHVPAGAADLPIDWASTNFNDSAWSQGRTGLGFDAGNSNLFVGSATNAARGKPVNQSSTGFGLGPELAVDGNLGNFTHTSAGQNLPATWEVNLGTNYGIERIVLHNRTSCCGSRLRDITVRVLAQDGTTNYVSALLNPENVLGGRSLNGPANLSLNLTQLTGGLVIGARVQVIRTPDPDRSGTSGQGNADEPDVLSLGEVEVFGAPAVPSFHPLIQTDLSSSMHGLNSSAFVRLSFIIPVEEAPPLDQLTLRAKYDDGLVAYLNGVEVARRNAPGSLAWNSAATSEHPDAAALQFEDLDLSPFIHLLQEGVNVLAIQGLNRAAGDDDFLILPELAGQSVRTGAERYFAQPTPEAANGGGYVGLVADTKFSVDRGFFETPFSLVITTATAGAEIRYTTNGSPPSATEGTVYTGPIPIQRTTVVRAIATKPGYRPTDVDTHTYVFLDNIIAQSHQSVTNSGFPGSWAGVAADYAMDPRITGPYAPQMKVSLRSLPSVFLSTSVSNLFDTARGIYTHTTSHGVAWERPVSMELVNPEGVSEFQVDCGLRIQGGYFRDPNATSKHSFRTLFKDEYGAGKLRHDLFKEETAVQEFDTLVFRSGANDGYSWAEARDTEQFTRDEFGRDLHRGMGHPSPHGIFVHLYLNGVYWGLFNICERPNEDFSSSYFGGEPEEWDANNAGDVKNGDLQAWNSLTSQAGQVTGVAAYERLQGNNPDGSRNPAYPVLFDKLNYIDYMIANIWGGNWDWPNKNFWFGRLRTTNSTGFKFYMWDFENTMGNNRARSPVNMVSPRAGTESSWVGQPHFSLRNFAEYRMDFADRVHRYFFNHGLLTPTVLSNRYRALADHVELAIVAESARWGDDNLNPPQDPQDWLRERDWILGTYLAQRSDVVLQQFRASGLYPRVGAPEFNQLGGFITTNFHLAMSHTNAAGIIYFTTNGTDPRLRGGTLSSAAQVYGGPIALEGNTHVRARVLSGTNWSAQLEATFTTAEYFKELAITEIMYNPPPRGAVSGDELEFLELKNTGADPLNLSGLSFTAGLTFSFTNGTRLAPGAFFVLARNPSELQAKYAGRPVHGVFSGRLDNAGETLTLSHIIGGPVLSVTYGDRAPWPLTPDRLGFSLVPSPGAPLNSSEPAHWRASSIAGGSPNADDPDPGLPSIVVNEVLSYNSAGPDMIELHNPSPSAVDISGWFLTDAPSQPMKFRVPAGTSIPANGFILFTESHFNPMPGASNSFSLDADGDDVFVFSGDANTNLTGYSHGFEFGAAPDGATFGRHIISSGEEQFPLQAAPTPGAANAGPRVGPVVISEIHYHPSAGEDAFLELKNISAESVPLFDLNRPTNAWRINGISFTFPAGVTLPAGGLAVVTESDPAAFRGRYSVPAGVPVFGPYAGALQNSGERLELQRLEPRGLNAFAWVTLEEVRYNDKAPWPVAADGSGPSLQRLDPATYGNDASNWTAALPTPGQGFPGGAPPAFSQQPSNRFVVAYMDATFSAAATGPGPLRYQWRFKGSNISGATNALLLLTNVQPSQAGRYTVIVFNAAGAIESSPALLSVGIPAIITAQPQSQNVRLGNSATFTVAAVSTSPMQFQWRFNGTNIPGATNQSLTVTDVGLDDDGEYTAVITDAVGPIISAPARLRVLVNPVIVQHPLSLSVPAGGTAVFSVTVTNAATLPVGYRWRRNGATVAFFELEQRTAFYAVTNAQTGGNYTVVVTNAASTTGLLSATAVLTILADADSDGLPDAWETEHGFQPDNAADATLDFDGDNMTNLEEYIAGTDPKDGSSYLKVTEVAATQSVRLAFFAVSNRTYTVEFADDLDAGAWSRLADAEARATNRVEVVVDPASAPGRFYRLVTPRQP